MTLESRFARSAVAVVLAVVMLSAAPAAAYDWSSGGSAWPPDDFGDGPTWPPDGSTGSDWLDDLDGLNGSDIDWSDLPSLNGSDGPSTLNVSEAIAIALAYGDIFERIDVEDLNDSSAVGPGVDPSVWDDLADEANESGVDADALEALLRDQLNDRIGAGVPGAGPDDRLPSEDLDDLIRNLTKRIAFNDTAPLRGNSGGGSGMAGRVRVDSAYRNNLTVTVVENSSANFTMQLSAPSGRNVTVFLQRTALSNSVGLDHIEFYVDGSPANFSTYDARGGWVRFEVGHFSTRTVRFSTPRSVQQYGGGDGVDTAELQTAIQDFLDPSGNLDTGGLQAVISSFLDA